MSLLASPELAAPISLSTRSRIQRDLIGPPAALGGEHGVVELKDALFGTVSAMGLLVLLPDDGELVEDIGHSIARLREVVLERRQLLRCLVLGSAPATVRLARQLEVEESGVQFIADLEAPFDVPREQRSIIAAVAGQWR
jgi:hypothetical protein